LIQKAYLRFQQNQMIHLFGLMKVKEEFFASGSFRVGNGVETYFGKIHGWGDSPLASQYPSLYNIVQCKQASIANVLSQVLLNIGFR
jgi:hypothetical protein